MEEVLQLETLIPKMTTTTTNSRRRRPLRSNTFDTLLHILSYSSSISHPPPQLDNCCADVVEPSSSSVILDYNNAVSDELLPKIQPVVENSRGDSGLARVFNETPMASVEDYDHNNVPRSKGVSIKDNHESENTSEFENLNTCGIAMPSSNHESQTCALGLHSMEIPERMENSSFMVSDDSSLNTHKSLQEERDSVKEAGDKTHDSVNEAGEKTQCTGIELTTPLFASCEPHCSPDIIVGTEAEEGEIPGELTSILEDDTSPKEMMLEELHLHGDLCKEQKVGPEKDTKSIPLSVDYLKQGRNGLEAELTENKRNLVDYSEMFNTKETLTSVKPGGYHCSLETGKVKKKRHRVKKSESTANSTRILAQVKGASGNNAIKIQDTASAKKDADANCKKKRQGPSSEEERSMKKICTLQDKCEIVQGNSTEPLIETGEIQKQVSVLKGSIVPAVSPEKLVPDGLLSEENASQKEVHEVTKEDDGKKKKRVLTKERKAKKKQKERIKRAEKNRKLGVKRLKLQPVVKEKTVSYCRHYLAGRCYEGDKCKFSHDTIPLTKSKPCCHFARQSCMKGDDCPFDHQLSKYPCNNIISKGFCSRRAACLFSHEMNASEGHSTTSSDCRQETKSSSMPDSLNFKKQSNGYGLSTEKVDAKSHSAEISTCKITDLFEKTPKDAGLISRKNFSIEAGSSSRTHLSSHEKVDAKTVSVGASPLNRSMDKNVVDNRPKSAQIPKGISIISPGKFSKESSSVPVVESVKIGNQTVQDSSNVVRNDNETSNKAPATFQRINFLSFCKRPPGGDSFSSLVLKKDDGIGKSPLSIDPKSAIDRIHGITRIRFSESDDSRNKRQIDSGSNIGAHIIVQDTDRCSDGKVQVNAGTASSSLSSGSELDFLAGGGSKTIPSLSQKSILQSTPSSLHKVVRSTLAFASKLDPEVKMGRVTGSVDVTNSNKEAGCSASQIMKTPPIWDLMKQSK